MCILSEALRRNVCIIDGMLLIIIMYYYEFGINDLKLVLSYTIKLALISPVVMRGEPSSILNWYVVFKTEIH